MMLAYQPIRSLATINIAINQGSSAFKRISEVIDKNIEINNEENFPSLNIKETKIQFQNIEFKYLSTKTKALHNINLNIEGGSMSAFVGHSGAGKSTIINLLPRFYDPQNGKIFIDGQDIRKVSLSSLREKISLVSQDVILFDGSIRQNVSYGKVNATEEEIKEACKFAAADEFISQMPNSYETLIGENGVKLSGGQKQEYQLQELY